MHHPGQLPPNKSFKPKPLRYANHMAGKACHVLRSTARLGLTLALGISMKILAAVGFVLSLSLCSCTGATAESNAPIGVWCSSNDDGATCWGIGETYPDGTADACGHMPDGVEFALMLTYAAEGEMRCETVTKSSHPHVMAPGTKFCSRVISLDGDRYSYAFADEARVRTSYRRTRQDKWCQDLIDALP